MMHLDFSTTPGLYKGGEIGVARKDAEGCEEESAKKQRVGDDETSADGDLPRTPDWIRKLRAEIDQAVLEQTPVDVGGASAQPRCACPATVLAQPVDERPITEPFMYQNAGILRELGGIEGWKRARANN